MEFQFKKDYPDVEKRKNQCKILLIKEPTKIPVILEKDPNSKLEAINKTKHLLEELGIIGNCFKENKIENNSDIEKNKKSQNRLSEENKCDEIDEGELKIVEQEISIINNDIEDFKVDTNKAKQDEFINYKKK